MLLVNLWVVFISLAVWIQRRLNDKKHGFLPRIHGFNCSLTMVVACVEFYLPRWEPFVRSWLNLSIVSTWIIIALMLKRHFGNKDINQTKWYPRSLFVALQVLSLALLVGIHLEQQLIYLCGVVSFLSLLFLVHGMYLLHHYMNTPFAQNDVKSIYRKLPAGIICLLLITFQSIVSCWWLDSIIVALYTKMIEGSTALEEYVRLAVAKTRQSEVIIMIDIATGQVVTPEKMKKQKRVSYSHPHGGGISEGLAKTIHSTHLHETISDPLSPEIGGNGCSQVLMIKGEVGPNIQKLIQELKEHTTLDRVSPSLTPLHTPTPSLTPIHTPPTTPRLRDLDSDSVSYVITPSPKPGPERPPLSPIQESAEESQSFDPHVHMVPSLLTCPHSCHDMFQFPNPVRNITSRLHAGCNSILTFLLLIGSSFPVFWYLWTYTCYHFFSFLLSGPRFNIQSWIIHYVLEPLAIHILESHKLSAGAPKRFATCLYLVFIVLSGLSSYLNLPQWTQFILVPLIYLNSLEAIYNVCVTSLLFFYGMQLRLLPFADQATWRFETK